MQSYILATILALGGYAAAQKSINVQTFGSQFDCTGPQSFNQLIPEFICQNAEVRSLQIQPGGGDSNGCFLETYQDSNCGIYQSRIGPLSGGFSSCIGQANPNTGELQPAFSFRLIC
ncbi:hypothetical protein Slin15195_G050150 [Septoria linicola]|uniref:Uncharacterized protein n=1 Tax=Septoria linicola TaxID=215465 RepID=A0A9Q9ATK2_9PEZI|nr:hypothetical protein Slin14017_G053670 [Septoria linicola]USW51696.1 hypothetical protein Slin15195_G050150 [Septoria linicola]